MKPSMRLSLTALVLVLPVMALCATKHDVATADGRAPASESACPDASITCSALWRPKLAVSAETGATTTTGWSRVTLGKADPGDVLVRWDSAQSANVWVTPDDFRPLLAKSKVQGARLGLKGDAFREWFQLTRDDGWKRDADPELVPNLARLDRDGSRIFTELAGNEWKGLAGALAQIPMLPARELPGAVGLGDATPGTKFGPPPKKLSACSECQKPAPAAGIPLLYKQSASGKAKEEKVVAAKRYLPNRVYARFSKAFNRWVFSKTDAHGNFPEPLEALGIGTQLSGAALGAESPLKEFKLAEDGEWSENGDTGAGDDGDDEEVVWIAMSPVKLRIETFKTALNEVAKVAGRPR